MQGKLIDDSEERWACMEVKKIFFDMDGVLADFGRGVEELCGLDRDCDDDLMWEAIKNVENYYDRLEWIPTGKDMIRYAVDKYGVSVVEILSAIPKPKRGIVTAEDDKRSWIAREFPDMKVNIVLRAEKKVYCTGKDCILIDDLKNNIEEWEACGGTGIWCNDAANAFEILKNL